MADQENEQRKRDSYVGGDERKGKEAKMVDAGKMGSKVQDAE